MAVADQGTSAESKKMKVMVALDDSGESFNALNWAITNIVRPKSVEPMVEAQAQGGSYQEEGCMVYVVHVQHPFHNYVYPAGPGLHTESVKKAQAEVSAAILEKALLICKQNMVRAETLILEGDPKEMICQMAEQMHVDLLVIGSRGLGQIKRAFLGSVSDYCAHHASCPVLIVKPPKGSK